MVATAMVAAPADRAEAEIVVRTSGGAVATSDEATVIFNAETGGWDVTLLALYAPGEWSLYEVHGDGGEIIDNLVIDVPCWAPFGSCIPAGSPCIVRVISDGPLGISTVRNIVQTGTAETILSLVDVRGDLGSVTVESMGDLHVGGDVTGDIRATTGDNPVRGIGTIETQGDILGDVTAEHGRIIFLYAHGRLGTEAEPVLVRAKHGIIQIAGLEGIYGDFNTRANGGAGMIFAFQGAAFVGTLETEAVYHNPFNDWPGRLGFWERFDGVITVGRSFDDAEQWIDLPTAGLGGQIVFNADGHPGGTWAAPIYVGPQDDGERVVLTGPGYDETAESLGGGSVGLVPFDLHASSCAPVSGAAVPAGTPGDPLVVRLRHYGPVRIDGPTPLFVERRPLGGGAYEPVPSGALDVTVAPDDANTVVVGPAPGRVGFAGGFTYRIEPSQDLVCAIAVARPVAWSAAYELTVEGATCDADFDGDGVVGIRDLVIFLSIWGPCKACPEDLDRDGRVSVGDLLTLLKRWGPC
jgi:hypothetical protein